MTSRHWQNSSSRSKPWCHGSRSWCQNISTPNTVSTYQSKNHIKVPFTHVCLFCRFCWHFRREKPFWSRALDVTATLFMGSTSNFHTWKPCHDWGRVSTSELPQKRLWNPGTRMAKNTQFLQHLSYGDSFEIIWWFSFLMVIHHSSPCPVQSHVKFQYAVRTPWKLPLVEPRLQQWGKGTKPSSLEAESFCKGWKGNLPSIKTTLTRKKCFKIRNCKDPNFLKQANIKASFPRWQSALGSLAALRHSPGLVA